MSKTQEALKLALEALGLGDDASLAERDQAITAIREALAEQPAQQQESGYKGWYCAHCQRGVDGSEVTYNEQHTVCGRVITDDLPPKPQQERWVERWYGSTQDRGWWIVSGRDHIAHLGAKVSSEEVRKIVDAHNRTSPPAQRKPLTDEQREEIAKGWRGRNWTVGDIIDATEAAHGIKE